MKKVHDMRTLASLGRFGDNTLRNVNGNLSHVNELEASLLDKYGKPMADILSSSPHTVNPITGLNEHWYSAQDFLDFRSEHGFSLPPGYPMHWFEPGNLLDPEGAYAKRHWGTESGKPPPRRVRTLNWQGKLGWN